MWEFTWERLNLDHDAQGKAGGTPAPRLRLQVRKSREGESRAPLADQLARRIQARSDNVVGETLRREQYDLRFVCEYYRTVPIDDNKVTFYVCAGRRELCGRGICLSDWISTPVATRNQKHSRTRQGSFDICPHWHGRVPSAEPSSVTDLLGPPL